jgi:hypothetical protein
MKISERHLPEALKLLRHGGEDAVRFFLTMARRCYRKGGHRFLENWIEVAVPALPESDRNAVLAGLLEDFFGGDDAIGGLNPQPHILH